jgi:hypothetical protein
MAGEKLATLGVDRARSKLRRNFRDAAFFETILCRSAALRWISVATGMLVGQRYFQNRFNPVSIS